MIKTIAFSLLGTQLDHAGTRTSRWDRWRPTVSLCSQDDLLIDELHLIHDSRSQKLASTVIEDLNTISPETKVIEQIIEFNDPWDFQEVYSILFDLCRSFSFKAQKHQYLFHITTGTHVAQICTFLLTESRHFPGRLIQTSPGRGEEKVKGRYQIIDLDLSRYDHIASRFRLEQLEGEDFLKGGIVTRNAAFNQLIAQIEKVAIRSRSPMLLTGPTGAGKSQLSSRIYELKKRREQVTGKFVSVNCATLQGDSSMAALFGHTKGAFTGAQKSREGFLLSANCGVLFLDEIGELGLDEQAMLLHALESKSFYPVGSDQEVQSDFQLIAGTNRNLHEQVSKGLFRADLLARINLWSYELPSLSQRREDIEPNVEFELKLFERKYSQKVEFNKEAKERFLDFSMRPTSLWTGNFRDLNAAIVRMATLCEGARIRVTDVDGEIERLTFQWQSTINDFSKNTMDLNAYLSKSTILKLDPFDQEQLKYVIQVCLRHPSMASAGRELFSVSRLEKSKPNDSTRLQKYLQKYSLDFDELKSYDASIT